MKVILLIIFGVLGVSSIALTSAAPSSCTRDLDWSEIPCYSYDNYPGIEKERKDWEKYYDHKGKEWMETRLAEMKQSVNNNSLNNWIAQETSIGDKDERYYENKTFSNVWYYYYLKGEIPDGSGKYIPSDYRESDFPRETNTETCTHIVRNNIHCVIQDRACLIATASYGSELSPQVQMLREIRDNTLLNTQSGKIFMNGFNTIYYSFSPTIAQLENDNDTFKETVKIFITPMIVALSIMTLADDSEFDVILYGMSTLGIIVGMYVVAPIVGIRKVRIRLDQNSRIH